MKILIMSDSHGHIDAMRRVIRLHRDADCMLFLGDGLSDATACEREFSRPIWQVRGNCDSFSPLYDAVPTEQILSYEGHRLLLTHGHRFGVKGGDGALVAYAAQAGCDIVLYGHTHEKHEAYLPDTVPPIHLFNPGSLGSARAGTPTYGLLQLTPTVVLFSHGEVPAV